MHTHARALPAQTERHPQSAQAPAHSRVRREKDSGIKKKLSAGARASDSSG